MAFTTKLNLTNGKFFQCASDTLNLSGTTSVGNLKYLTDKSSTYTARSITDAGYVTGLTSNLQSQVNYLSGQTDLRLTIADFNSYSGTTDTRLSGIESDIATNTSDIATNTSDIATNASNIATNTSDIATNASNISTNTSDIATNASDIQYLSGQTDLKLAIADFDNYSGTTDTRLTGIESDVATNTSDIATNASNIATNTSDIATNVSNIATNASDIQYLSGQTDLKLATADFDNYSATTDTRLTGIESDVATNTSNIATNASNISTNTSDIATNASNISTNTSDIATNASDIQYLSGQTDLKLAIADFNAYSATTDTRLDGIETDISTNATDISNISGLAITGASNGLTKSGQDVILGGTLNFAANINGGGNSMLLGTSSSKLSQIQSHVGNGTDCSYIAMFPSYFSLTHSGSTGLKNVCFGDNGFVYGADYSGCFTTHSLVDKAYVDSSTGAISASNGLTRDGDNIVLGGTLTGCTVIKGSNSEPLYLSGATILTDAHFIKFEPNASQVPSSITEGMIYYSGCALNFVREYPNVVTQLGEEELIRVTNETGSLISNGTVVYINGASGTANLPTIGVSDATLYTSTNSIGITTHDIANNAEGYVTTQGVVHNVNTGAYSAGDELYLDPTTPGGFTNVKPTHPDNVIRVGYVTKVGTSDGEILVDLNWEADYVDIDTFTGYTANTQTALDGKVESSTFNSYSATTDGRLNSVEEVTDVAVTGATNGLTKSGRNAELGGSLTKATSVTGAYELTLSPSADFVMKTVGENNLLIDGQSNSNVVIRSQSGTNLSKTSFTNAIGIQMDINQASGFAIYDGRSGSNQTGIVYASDYSSNFVDRSLVDKAYVDSIAAGQQVKESVLVATTANIALSGTATIDGITVSDGDRVLVKNQTDDTENGIYVVSSGGSWTRASDYDFTPTGEVANGDLIPVISGTTLGESQWVLTSPDPVASGDSLTFSLFSQLLQISGGDGINISTGSPKEISVDLATNSALEFITGALSVASTIASSGLTWSNGKLNVNASETSPVGAEIPVRFNASHDLVVDKNDFSYLCASNGLTIDGCNVTLGGTLTGDTTVSGNDLYDLNLVCADSLNLGFNNVSIITDAGSNGGIRYAADYSGNFVDRSLVDKAYVIDTLTGASTPLTYCDGISKTGAVIQWGGTLSTDRALLRNTSNFCIKNTGIDIISDCSCATLQPTGIDIYTDNGSCVSAIGLNNDGSMSLSANSATQGLTITSAAHGAVYAGDYEANFVDRSLVTKKYVTSEIENTITGASNGLTKSGQDVILGGTLTGATVINGYSDRFELNEHSSTCTTTFQVYTNNASLRVVESLNSYQAAVSVNTAGVSLSACDSGGVTNSITVRPALMCTTISSGNFVISDTRTTTKGIEYSADYSADFTDRSLVDKGYVTSQVSGITTNAITGASNGLTKSGQSVVLGGALTNDTCVYSDSVLTFDVTSLEVLNPSEFAGSVCMNTLHVTGATTIDGTTTLNSVAAGSTSDDVLTITSGGEVQKISASSLGEDNNRYSVTAVTNSTVNLTGSEYVVLVNTSIASVTVNLPTSPTVGTALKIKDKSGNALTNNIVVDAGVGKTIDDSQCATINTNYGALELVYGETNSWYSLAFIS